MPPGRQLRLRRLLSLLTAVLPVPVASRSGLGRPECLGRLLLLLLLHWPRLPPALSLGLVQPAPVAGASGRLPALPLLPSSLVLSSRLPLKRWSWLAPRTTPLLLLSRHLLLRGGAQWSPKPCPLLVLPRTGQSVWSAKPLMILLSRRSPDRG